MSVQNFMAVHPVVVEIFQSGPKWWINCPTKRHWHPCSHAASTAKNWSNRVIRINVGSFICITLSSCLFLSVEKLPVHLWSLLHSAGAFPLNQIKQHFQYSRWVLTKAESMSILLTIFLDLMYIPQDNGWKVGFKSSAAPSHLHTFPLYLSVYSVWVFSHGEGHSVRTISSQEDSMVGKLEKEVKWKVIKIKVNSE